MGMLCQELLAYLESFQTLDEIFAIRQLIEKSAEWGQGLCYAKSDIFKAYDRVSLCKVIATFQDIGCPRALVCSIVREWLSWKSTFRWGSVSSGAVKRGRGIPQGDPLSPLLFNIVMSHALKPMMEKWRQADFGIRITTPENL